MNTIVFRKPIFFAGPAADLAEIHASTFAPKTMLPIMAVGTFQRVWNQ